MGKDPSVNAEKELNRAEFYYEGEDYKKAAKYFTSAAELYFDLDEYKIARECYYYAAKSLESLNKSDKLIEALRHAGDCALLVNDFSSSNKFFKSTIRYVPDLKKVENRNFYYLIYSTLSYLCLFLEGKQDQGLEFIKEIKKNIDNEYFKESPYVSLITNLTLALRDKNEKYLKKAESISDEYSFSDAEIYLFNLVIALAKANLFLKTELSLDRDQYTTKDIMNFNLNIDSSPLLKVLKNPTYNFKVKELKISNVSISFSDNITAQIKPELPEKLKIGEQCDIKYALKPHFQVDEPFIGPISLTCEIDDDFIMHHKIVKVINPNIISPPPSLDISMKNLRPPLIGQTFPMEFLIENNSEGDALELQLNLQFPEQLKVMRGTTKKQIYSLSSNDKITWEINLKPLEVGDYTIDMDFSFKDPDQNLIEDSKTFPFSIKL
ncbi:MAG: hypothetical protein ACFFAO_07515 [Candidatus Hermodarchaeota archaeon]